MQIPIQRASPDMERGANLRHRHGRVGVEFPRKRNFLGIARLQRWSASHLSARAGSLEPSNGAFFDDFSLELGQGPKI